MIEVVNVRFPKDFKFYQFEVGNLEVKYNDWCVVEIDRGIDLGRVVGKPKIIETPKSDTPLPKILRLATLEDWRKVEENKKKEKSSLSFCKKKIQEHTLPMKLVTVHHTLDGGKVIFYFTAETRVDFRELVKDLVRHFKTRIELRQIGVRDEAKLYGGYGWCGRELCCATFLKEFDSIQIKMAKEQSLILTPGKISGICGRLMCCLSYEYEIYADFRRRAPKCGTRVITQKGPGVVQDFNVLKEQVIVKLENNMCLPFPLEEIQIEQRTQK